MACKYQCFSDSDPVEEAVVHCAKIMLFIALASKPEADAVAWY